MALLATFRPRLLARLRQFAAMFVSDRDTLRPTMEKCVFMTVQEFQILRPIVGSILIDVMDFFRWQQWPTKISFHQVSMLKDVSLVCLWVFRHTEQYISQIIHVTALAALHAIGIVAADIASGIALNRARGAVGPCSNRRKTATTTRAQLIHRHGRSFNKALLLIRFSLGFRLMAEDYLRSVPVIVVRPFDDVATFACTRDSLNMPKDVIRGSIAERLGNLSATSAFT